MFPWGHAAIGYLLYTLVSHTRYDRPPTDGAFVVLLIGTQFPDLVDKPLAWSFALLPSGRSLAHTLLVAGPVCAGVYLYARKYDREEWGAAFGLGYLSHVLIDAVPDLLRGNFEYAQYLLWPILPLPPYEEPSSVVEPFVSLRLTPFLALQFAMLAVTITLWWYDGKPGIGVVTRGRHLFLKSER